MAAATGRQLMEIRHYQGADKRDQAVTLFWEADKPQKAVTVVISREKDCNTVLWEQQIPQSTLWLELNTKHLEPGIDYLCHLTKHFIDNTEENEELKFSLQDKIFQGKWIGHPQGATSKDETKPAPIIRKYFDVRPGLRGAKLFISGLGFYEFRINDKKIEDTYLNPPFTQYDKRTLYDVWSMAEELEVGSNKLDIQLGNGWYNSFADDAWNFNKAAWKSQPKVLFDLILTYEDGSQEVFLSGTDCLIGKSAITFDGLRNGEYFDQRHSAANWPRIADECFGEKPIIVNPPGGLLEENTMPKIGCHEKLMPVSIVRLWDDRFLVDFGKNIAGWCNLRLPQSDYSGEITIRYGEKLSTEGILDQRDIGKFLFSGEYQTDRFYWSGAMVTWHPYYCYHGFQYVEITGLKELTPEMLEAWFIHTNLEKISELSTNQPVLQWLYDATIASTLGNYHGIPTDCPQREKNGWTGDVTLSCEQMLRNFDMDQAFWKWLQDLKDAQRFSGELPGIVPTSGWGYEFSVGPAWDSVLIEMPWQMYRHYGSKRALYEAFPYMERYMTHLIAHADDWIINYGLGDWCAPTLGGNEGDYHCPTAITGTGIFYHCCSLMEEICQVLGKSGQVDYATIGEKIKKRFNEAFIDKKTGTVKSETQTAYATALYFDLVEGDTKKQLLQNLVQVIKEHKNHIDCGILGTKYLFEVLFANDLGDLAYKLLTQTTYPSFGYWQGLGATTLFETWKGFHSRNHHMFSSPAEYLFKHFAGIQIDEAGYQRVIISPVLIPEMTEFSASQKTPQGNISVAITGEQQKKVRIQLPANIGGTLLIPSGYQTAHGIESFLELRGEVQVTLLPVR